LRVKSKKPKPSGTFGNKYYIGLREYDVTVTQCMSQSDSVIKPKN